MIAKVTQVANGSLGVIPAKKDEMLTERDTESESATDWIGRPEENIDLPHLSVGLSLAGGKAKEEIYFP